MSEYLSEQIKKLISERIDLHRENTELQKYRDAYLKLREGLKYYVNGNGDSEDDSEEMPLMKAVLFGEVSWVNVPDKQSRKRMR